MTIETKYNIGDEVWAVVENKVCKYPILNITVKKGMLPETIETLYYIGLCEWRYEQELFPTKEELLKSL